jgi:MFS family permease
LYSIAVVWAFFAFTRMALYQASMLLIVLAASVGVGCLVFLIHAFAYIQRHRKQPPEDEQRAAFQQITKRMFAVAWAGFVGGCIAAMIVVVEVNDPFADEVMGRVVKERSVLFWSVVAAGFVLGALDRISKIIAERNREVDSHDTD